ncbi:MAG: DsrE family protein [Verrucomicrobiae bacterium]|nr:DsrE family protein [Verrucomicrobiae bacterium]
MKPSVLFIIKGDPRTSHRPAEAIRIAAGVGTWKKVDITVYLHGPAVLALGEFVDELVDEDNYTRYLPIIGEFGRPVYVQAGEPCLSEIEPATLPYEAIDDRRLAELAAAHSSVVYF